MARLFGINSIIGTGRVKHHVSVVFLCSNRIFPKDQHSRVVVQYVERSSLYSVVTTHQLVAQVKSRIQAKEYGADRKSIGVTQNDVTTTKRSCCFDLKIKIKQ